RECVFHKFSPQGVSGVVVISESHLAIHTWPELGYAAVDVFTCGEKVDPWDACDYLVKGFQADSIEAKEVKRGVFPDKLVPKAAVNQ
ncbi:MAG: adenosylmethionine decarboxylase, partial [Clostridia bacterium]|nr:adenosylmethionine decarboxylase [Clostridia bacterium]